jgi:hypothetical protein
MDEGESANDEGPSSSDGEDDGTMSQSDDDEPEMSSSCVDEKPDARDISCATWAEWGECANPNGWLNGYCKKSCGRCDSTDPSDGDASDDGGDDGDDDFDLPDIGAGMIGWSTRYWDCCKPHCAWNEHGATTGTCGADGSTYVGAGDRSACEGGNAYMCSNQAPRAVSARVAYGTVAVPNPGCGQCYHIQFSGTSRHLGADDPGSVAITGKHMIVKVTNAGGDVQDGQFDMLIPGGGVGLFNACSAQWSVSNDQLGAQYGGFLSVCKGDHAAKKRCVRERCALLPAGDVRNGCLWFVDWFEVADNPDFRAEPIACPADL